MSKENPDKDLPSMTEEQLDLQSTNSFNSFLSEDSRTSHDSFNGFDHRGADHIKTADPSDMRNHESELDSVQKRLDTFSRWPVNCPIKPKELAEAGFYSKGLDDRVVCFKCDLHLRQWKTGDDPWKEHKLFNESCPFLMECENERDSSNLQNTFRNTAKESFSRFEEVVFPQGTPRNHHEDDVSDIGLQLYREPEGVLNAKKPQGFSQGRSNFYYEQPLYRNPDYPQIGFRDHRPIHLDRMPTFAQFQRPDDQRIGREVTEHRVEAGSRSSQVHMVGPGASIYYINPEEPLYVHSGGQGPPQEIRPGGKLIPVYSEALQTSRPPFKGEPNFAVLSELGAYTSQESTFGRNQPHSASNTGQIQKQPGYGEKWPTEVKGTIAGELSTHSSQGENKRYLLHQQQNKYPKQDPECGRYLVQQHQNSKNTFQEPRSLQQTQFPEKLPQAKMPYEPQTIERKLSDKNGALHENYHRIQQYPFSSTKKSSSPQALKEVYRLEDSPSHSGQARQPTPFAAFPVKDPSLQPAQRLVRHEDARHITSSSDLASQHHRLTTFVDWPHDHPIHPCDLSAAGFYYLGKNDSVRCFKCDISLHNWDPDDTPWGEHKRWSPQCPLVLENERHNEDHTPGQNAIAQERYPSQNTPQFRRPDQSNFSSDKRVPIVGGGRLVHPGWNRQQQPSAQTAWNVGRPQDQLLEKQYTQWQTQPISAEQEAGHVSSGRQAGSTGKSSSNPNNRSCSPRGSALWERNIERLSELGFNKQQIDDAISVQVQATGLNFASHTDLVAALLESQARLQRNPTIPQPTEGGCWGASPPPIIIPSDIPTSLLQGNQNPAGRNCSSAVTSPTTPFPGIISLRRSFSEPSTQRFSDSGEESLEEKLERMQEERMCKICMDAEVSVVFLPCGHLSCCEGCANGMNLCPMCRSPIQEKVRTFLS